MVWESDGHKLSVGINNQFVELTVDCPHGSDCPSATDGGCAVQEVVEDIGVECIKGKVEHVVSPIPIRWGWEDEELWIRVGR
jgi:hypothetical protein